MKLLRALRKFLYDPIRYGWRDYAAYEYWDARHRKYGMDIRGSGNEGENIIENRVHYIEDKEQLDKLCRAIGLNLGGKRVLDVGCGNGEYTRYCWSSLVFSYLGIDISDALFPDLREWAMQHDSEQFQFTRQDCTILGGLDCYPKFDVVLAISVVEHFTTRVRLAAAMVNMRNALAPHGVVIVGPVYEKAKLRLFYHHPWRESDVKAIFDVIGRVPFRGGTLLALRAK